jgi:hypothetical protein
MELSGLWEDIRQGWPIVTARPDLFIGILVFGTIVGWGAAWVVLNQRLMHHKELVSQYERDSQSKGRSKRVADSMPPPVYSLRKRDAFIGIAVLVGLGIVLYSAISSLKPVETSNISFVFQSIFHLPKETEPLRFNIGLNNIGQATAHRLIIKLEGLVSDKNVDDKSMVDYASARMRELDGQRQNDITSKAFGSDIPATHGVVITVPNAEASAAQIAGFGQGATVVYVFLSMAWQDSSLASDEYWIQDICAAFTGSWAFYHNCADNYKAKIRSSQ